MSYTGCLVWSKSEPENDCHMVGYNSDFPGDELVAYLRYCTSNMRALLWMHMDTVVLEFRCYISVVVGEEECLIHALATAVEVPICVQGVASYETAEISLRDKVDTRKLALAPWAS